MERLTNISPNGEIWITDDDFTRRIGRKEAAYMKLKKYEDLEEQGLLLQLPCKVGDTVYILRIDNTKYLMNNKRIWEIVETNFEIRHFESICKTVFLTRAEAEKALRKMNNQEK